MEQRNELVVRTFFEAVTNKDYAKIRQCIHEAYAPRSKSLQAMKKAVSMTTYSPDKIIDSGTEPLIERIKMLFDGFDDFNIKINRLMVDCNDVWVDVRVSGRHVRNILGVAPSFRRIEYRGYLTYRMADGKIIENDVLFDWFALLNQLGVFVKPPNTSDIEEYLNSIRKFQKLIGVEYFDNSYS